MLKPFKVVIEVFVMAENTKHAVEIAEELVESSCIEDYNDRPIYYKDDSYESLEATFGVVELTVDEVNKLFEEQNS